MTRQCRFRGSAASDGLATGRQRRWHFLTYFIHECDSLFNFYFSRLGKNGTFFAISKAVFIFTWYDILCQTFPSLNSEERAIPEPFLDVFFIFYYFLNCMPACLPFFFFCRDYFICLQLLITSYFIYLMLSYDFGRL